MTQKIQLKIGVSGVRGIVGEALSPSLAANFAAAFGGFVGRGAILVGRDTRPSGEMLENAVTAGLLASGCHVLLAGIIPTPTLQIAVKTYEASGGVAITASHNPSEWNALKFIDANANFLSEGGMDALLDVYNQPGDDYVPEKDFRGIGRVERAFDLHMNRILERIDVKAIRKAKFRVAADCCNGVGALYTRLFLERLGCAAVFPVFEKPSGIFERIPEPVPPNLTELCRRVTENRCDIGFAQDPDGDRISMVDENGIPLGVQDSILLPADRVMERTPGNVVANVQTTGAFDEIAKRHGCPVEYSKVGEINVAETMSATGAVFGTEGGSGGILWTDMYPCRDSFSAMALTLEAMALRKKSFSEIMSGLPHYHSAVLKVEQNAQNARNALRKLEKKYASRHPVLIDGIRLNFDNAWILARQSNTEPVIRIYAESGTSLRDAQKLAARFADELKSEF